MKKLYGVVNTSSGKARRTIRQNRFDNWRGYEGGRFVREFGNSSTHTAEQAAREWQSEEYNPTK